MIKKNDSFFFVDIYRVPISLLIKLFYFIFWTFNFQAALYGSIDVLHWLFEKGADPNKQDCKVSHKA